MDRRGATLVRVTPQEALDWIAALCEERDRDPLEADPIWPHEIRAVIADVLPNPAPRLDPQRAADTLDWCKREGGLDLYDWGDLISRLNDCIVPTPLDAPARLAAAYRDGFREGQKYPEPKSV